MNPSIAPVAVPYDVVALVTSAGGLDAVSLVLADLPPDLPVAVVVGQHLGIDSALVDILARRTQLPVAWVEEGTRLEAGQVHVCPPYSRLEILPDGSCTLAPFDRHLLTERPLDGLLQSVGDSYGPRSVAVVLTGMGRDGAAGARALKAAGGAVLVQSEESAAFPDMPRAAIEAGAADLVVPLAGLGRALLDVLAGGRFPQPRNELEAREALFGDAGTAGVALRGVDWPATALGPVLRWPPVLKSLLPALLQSRFPQCLYWGDELLQLYNEAWIAVLGSHHPQAAGSPARPAWAVSWTSQLDALRGVLQTGQAIYVEDEPVATDRHGFLEEAYFTVSHSPVRDERGDARAVLTVATETTGRVIAQRRLQATRSLAVAAGDADNVALACARTMQVLGEAPRDLPFALLYLVDAAGLRATLRGSAGVTPGSSCAPYAEELLAAGGRWPLGKVVRQGEAVLLEDLQAAMPGLHAGPWPEPPSGAMLLPLPAGPAGQVLGVLVAGLSPRLPMDAAYREFLQLAAREVGNAVARARERERERDRLAQLAELDRAKTEFFSNVSHEFRTPLTLILGPLEDLLGAPEALAPAVRTELELASRNATRLLHLVDTLLDFSQIHAGRLRAQFQPTDLARLTCDVAALFRSAFARGGVALELDCPPLSEPVKVDPRMWEQIVSNLLSNALKFTFAGSVSVRLRELPQHVELVVSDTGVGIPEEELGSVFRRFHRVPGMRARTEEGAGIGLALVHELVQLHHGRVRVRSRPGEGSTFTVWLNRQSVVLPGQPVVQSKPAHTAGVAQQLATEAERWSEGDAQPQPADTLVGVPGVPGVPGAASPVRVPGARVLVADDNADMRDYLARSLGAHWEVTVAADGEQALAEAQRSPPDLVLADVMMPGLDGFALLRSLRADPRLKGTPVVLSTARTQEDAAIEGLLAGADDYIAKPFSSRELVARIGAQLQLAQVRRRGERELRELLALMPVGVYACDVHGRFNYWNQRAVELWGREPDAEDRFWALSGAPRAFGGDGQPLLPEESAMSEVLRTGAAVHGRELVILRADGRRLAILLNIRPLHDDGRIVGAVATFLDVTARRQAESALQDLNEELEERVAERTQALRTSEQHLRQMLNMPGIGVLTFDAASGDLLDANDAFLAMSGYTRAQVEARALGWRTMTPPEYQALSERQLQMFAATGRIGPYEKEYLHADGSRSWMLFAGAKLPDGNLCKYAIDISDRKRAEAALRESEQRLRALEQAGSR